MSTDGIYSLEYQRRKREMDSPLWESERKTFLEKYFFLWPEIEKMGSDESCSFESWEKKQLYPDHSPRMTPDLEALFDFLVFLSKNHIHHEFVEHDQKWLVYVYYK
jgi:hypothetical protein